MALGNFTLTGTVWQVVRDTADAGTEQDISPVLFNAVLTSNYPSNVGIPDGDGIVYVGPRTLVSLSDGTISEDGATPGISLTAHDPSLFGSPLQWTITPGYVTLNGKRVKPEPWTFNAALNGETLTLGAATGVAGISITLANDAVPQGSVGLSELSATGTPTAAKVLHGNNTWGMPLSFSTPASASATGVQGEVRVDAGFVYVCTATNTWKRVAISTW